MSAKAVIRQTYSSSERDMAKTEMITKSKLTHFEPAKAYSMCV